ncbi:HD domain-containing protein [Paenibacillus tarimensis]
MDEEKLLNSAKAYVKQALKHETTGHDWWHIYRVTEMARHIAVQEGANVLICQLAALFHDLADEKVVASKEEGLTAIKSWLEQNKTDSSIVEAVLDIISTMSYRGGNGAPMETLEGMVVQDADRLDAIGAVGIARTFVYAGSKGHAIYDPQIAPRERMTVEQYWNDKSTAVNHFYEKLFKLQGLMNTRAAKRMAAHRHAFMERYMEQFYLEWNLEESAEMRERDTR